MNHERRVALLRWANRTILVVAAVLATVCCVLDYLQHHLKEPLLRVLIARSGRQIRIDGSLEAHLLSPHPTVLIENLYVGNPTWLPAGVAAQASHVAIYLEWQLAPVPLRIRRLEVLGARLHALEEPDGRANWHLHADGPGSGPPLMRSLYMPDAYFELQDKRHDLQFNGTVSAGQSTDETHAPPLLIAGRGQLNGRKAEFQIIGEPLANAREGRPYHFDVEAHSGATRITGRGLLERPFDFRAQRLLLQANGPDLKDLYYLVGLRLPDSGPFQLSAKVARENKRFTFSDLSVTSGSSDLGGTIRVDNSGPRRQIVAKLASAHLRLADLGVRAAGRASPDEEPSTVHLSDTPLRLNGLLHTDSKIIFRAEQLDAAEQSLHAISGTLLIRRGVVTLQGLEATLAQGRLAADARYDAASAAPEAELDVTLTGVRLQALRVGERRNNPISGVLSGQAHLISAGKSAYQLAAAASGTISAIVTHGELDASLAEAASLDVTGLIGARHKEHKGTLIRCGAVRLDVRSGTATAHTLVLDTADALLAGSGTVNLGSETLDLTVRGRPKHPGLTLRSAIRIQGELAHPQVHLTAAPALAQGAAAVALGTLLTPVGGLLAFLNPGLTHDADCSSLVAEVGQAGAAANDGFR